LRFLTAYNIVESAVFPLRDDFLSHWALWLANEGKPYSTITNYFYDLAAYQVAHWRGPALRRNTLPLFDAILKTIRAKPPPAVHPPLDRRPITRHHLHIIRSSLNISTPLDATIWAAACSAFYGLMRVGEFTTRDGMPFDPSWQARRRDFQRGWDSAAMRPFWSFRLPRTKTGAPGNVFLGFSGEFDCPCSALDNMFRICPGRIDDPAFCIGPLPLRRSTFISAVRKPLAGPRLSSGIHGHSFRIGGATLLAAAGYPDHIIQLAGRWQSSVFVRYIRQLDQLLPQTVATLATRPFPLDWRIPATSSR